MATMSKDANKELCDGKFKFRNDSEVVCQYCQKIFKYHGSLSSLRYHLANKHPFAAKKCKNTSELPAPETSSASQFRDCPGTSSASPGLPTHRI